MGMPLISDTDDRRTCKQCQHVTPAGPCQAARRQLLTVLRTYEANREQLQRCVAYLPNRSDPDQRPGRVRWPGLVAIPREGNRR